MINIGTRITNKNLLKSWKLIRRQLKRAQVRDIIDFLEYDINPNYWINRLIKQIKSGSYEPKRPLRFSVAKSNGFYRIITQPSIPDLVLFRTLTEQIQLKAKKFQRKHVYFRQSELSKAQLEANENAKYLMDKAAADYSFATVSVFLQWLNYAQYRKRLILNKIYPYFVVTDVSNFFDTVLYSHISDALRLTNTKKGDVGLIFYILEKLSLRFEYTPLPNIGLPVDEFDCSRVLANLLLFPHDDRLIVHLGSEDSYVRWMDDQLIGVKSKAEGLLALSAIQKSLNLLHLTPNAGKSKILSLQQARRFYHLDINESLDNLEDIPHETIAQKKYLGMKVRQIWKKAIKHE